MYFLSKGSLEHNEKDHKEYGHRNTYHGSARARKYNIKILKHHRDNKKCPCTLAHTLADYVEHRQDNRKKRSDCGVIRVTEYAEKSALYKSDTVQFVFVIRCADPLAVAGHELTKRNKNTYKPQKYKDIGYQSEKI